MIQRQPYLPRFMAGGPGNPMGARALYLGGTVYRIHGTNQPDTIGTPSRPAASALSTRTSSTSTTACRWAQRSSFAKQPQSDFTRGQPIGAPSRRS